MATSNHFFRNAVGAVAAALVVTALPASAAEAVTPDDRFEQGKAAYENNHWPLAFERFAALADEGHAEAARIARDMARYGQALYGERFAAGPQRQQRWNALAHQAARRPAEAQALQVTTLETRP